MAMEDESPHRLRKPDHRHRRLLRTCHERPRSRSAAEQVMNSRRFIFAVIR
jgi:hypothetical protein